MTLAVKVALNPNPTNQLAWVFFLYQDREKTRARLNGDGDYNP